MLYDGFMQSPAVMVKLGSKTLEYNARFGDPETQVVLPRLKSDLVDVMLAKLGYDFDSVYVGGGTPTVMIDELDNGDGGCCPRMTQWDNILRPLFISYKALQQIHATAI